MVFGFIAKKIENWSDNNARKDLTHFVQLMESASGQEAAHAFIATSMAAELLRQVRSLPMPFPEDLLRGSRLVKNDEEIAALSTYIMDLTKMHRMMTGAKATPKGEFMASGILVLQHSLRVVQRVEMLLPLGRSLWRELMRGFDYTARINSDSVEGETLDAFVEELRTMVAQREQKSWGPTFADLCFVPELFVPDWQGLNHWENSHLEVAADGG